MATVRKRSWTTRLGEKKTGWELSYVDRHGGRHRKLFTKKGDADSERVRVEGELAAGVHVPDRKSLTVLDAARLFLVDFEDLVKAGKRERSTLRGYRQHIDLHLAPHDVSRIKLSRLGGPDCKAYARVLEGGLSDAMAVRVMGTFRMVLRFAQGEGWLVGNPADAVSVRVTGERGAEGDEDGVTIPPKAQLKALIGAAEVMEDDGRVAAMVYILMFSGLRASELRGLRRRDLRLGEGAIDVRQRADRWNQIGPCKTKNSRRSVPIPPAAVKAVRRWLVKAPPSELGLVFPNGMGNVESYANIYHRLWVPLMANAGLADVVKNGAGDEVARPWFALHALRHVAVSLWIEQGAPPKKVQTWAGHASIQFTQDRYGHLWADPTSDQAIVRAIEKDLLG